MHNGRLGNFVRQFSGGGSLHFPQVLLSDNATTPVAAAADISTPYAIHLGHAASLGFGVIISIAITDNTPLATLPAFNPQGSIIFCIFVEN